jgi:hypothetical protein
MTAPSLHREGAMTKPQFVRRFGQVAILGTGVLFAAASNSPAGGDRQNGGCPPEEECSPDTPSGLFFGAHPLGDGVLLGEFTAPHRTAVGGRQSVFAFLDDDAQQEFTGFDAKAAGASFRTDAPVANGVGVVGLAEGTDYLRLVEPGTDLLYDRISLQTATVTQVNIVPHPIYLLSDPELSDQADPVVAYHIVGEVDVVVQLWDDDDQRDVDETLLLTGADELSRDASQWDRYKADTLNPGANLFEAALGDGSSWPLSLDGVDHVDQFDFIASEGAAEPGVTPLPNNGSHTYCFRAKTANVTVLGAPYDLTASAELSATPGVPGCVSVSSTLTGTSTGTGTLTIGVDGLEKTYQIPIVAAMAKPAASAGPTLPAATPAHAGAGERASGIFIISE